jgi:peptidoglycan L-alanyl-D-glutamate endopeptidase CwlK
MRAGQTSGVTEQVDPINADEIDAETRRVDLYLKREQLGQMRRPQVNWSVVIPVVVAFVGVITAVIAAYLNGRSQLDVEHHKAQITLIVEAVKTGINNPAGARNNLRFFADAGLLDPAVKTLVDRGESPVLPASTSEPRDTIFQSVDSDLQHLHPLVRDKVRAVLGHLIEERIPISLYEGFRDPVHQEALYSRGRITKSPVISTDVGPWASLRQYGLAVTFGVYENGLWSWNYDDSKQVSWWGRLKTLAGKEGLEMIAADPAAFQVSGIKVEDLLQGHYPPHGDEGWAHNLSEAIKNWSSIQVPPAPKEASHL